MITYSLVGGGIKDDRIIIMRNMMGMMGRHKIPKVIADTYLSLIIGCDYDKLIEITNAIIRLCNNMKDE